MRNIHKPLIILLVAFSSVSISVLAQTQTGPGGVGSSANISIWLDGSQVLLNDGDRVSLWEDRSGNGNNATQSTLANQPTLNSSLGINGVPALSFDGSNDSLNISAVNSLNTDLISWFVVAQATNTLADNGRGIIKSVYNTSNDLWGTQYRRFTTYSEWFNYARSSTNSVTPASVLQVTQSSAGHTLPFITSSSWRSTNQIDSRTNGLSASTGTGRDMPASTHSRSVIGKRNLTTSFFSGLIGEIIVFSTELNTAQNIIINNYLSSKYNVSIGTDDKYSFEGTHNNELAGIGRNDASNQHLAARGTSIVEFTAASLNNGEYLIWAHDDNVLTTDLTDVPNSYLTSLGERMTRTWRVSETGATGNVTISFDLTGIQFGHPDDYELLIDADGDFTSGTTIVSGNLVGDIVSFTVTGAQLNSGDIFTVANSNVSVIRSIVSGQDWNQTSTWSCSCIPLITNYVVISDNHIVNLTDNQNAARLIVNNNAELSIASGGLLNIAEHIDVIGTIVSDPLGTINFIGSSLQTVNTNGTINFGSLTMNNTSVGTQLQTGNYTLSGVLTLTDGDLDMGGNQFTFISTASNTASIGVLTGAATLLNSGNVRVQRFIPTGVAGYRNIGSPQTNMPIEEWDDEVFISGPGFPDGCAFSSNGCYRSARLWNATTQQYLGIDNISTLIPNGTGVEIWLGDNLNSFSQTTLTSSGDINLNLSSNITIRNGWNLVSNPFLAPIDFDNIIRNSAGTGNYHYVWDPSTNGFQFWDGGAQTASVAHLNNGILAPFQGFWVFHTGSTTSITVNQSAKSIGSSDLFLRESISDHKNNFFNISLVDKDTESKVITEIRLINGANVDFDILDLPKPPSILVDQNYNSIYTKSSDGIDVVVNSLPDTDECFKLPIYIDVFEFGKYELNFSNLPSEFTVTLFDKIYETKTLIKEATIIEFILNDQLKNNDRFELIFEKIKPCKFEDAKQSQMNIYYFQNELKIEYETIPQSYTVEIYNSLGQKIYNSNLIESNNEMLNYSLPFFEINGIYFVKICDKNGQMIKTQKFTNF